MTATTLTTLPLADTWTMHGGSGWAWMAPMMIGMALFWGAIIVGLAWLVRDSTERRYRRPEETALAVLDRHLAEGALSLDDYQERRAVLTAAALPHQNVTSEPREGSQR